MPSINRAVWLATCALVAAVQGCASARPSPVRVEMQTVRYASPGGADLLLDLYRPAGARERLPVIVFVHGGGWSGGTRTDGPDFRRRFARDGFAMASIDYRLGPAGVFPRNVEDVKTAVRFLRSHADAYGLDPDRICLWGTSAGGHLASVAALAPRGTFEGTEWPDASSAVSCVLDAYGPTRFSTMDQETAAEAASLQAVAPALVAAGRGPGPQLHAAPTSPESRLLGAAIGTVPEKVREASPITYISAAAPEFLIMHGLADNAVPHRQSERLYEALAAAGGDVELRLVDGLPHGFFDRTELDSLAGPFIMDVRTHPRGGAERRSAAHAGAFEVARAFFVSQLKTSRSAAVAAPPTAATSDARTPSDRCAALVQAATARLGARVVIASAELHAAAASVPPPAGSPPWAAPTPATPEHCEVRGKADEHVAADGQRYAIGFHLRLPTHWNGRFLFQGGGGTDGNLGDAIGAVSPGAPTALDRGFAVVSTDAGHDNATNRDPRRQGQVVFGYDYQARVDYAERSLEVVARIGKSLVAAFYGREPERSYFFGCSNGGRQGMIFAQRFPELFDGIVATAPAFDVPKAAIAEAWDTQAFAALAKRARLVDDKGMPQLVRTFSDQDLALVSRAVLDACDDADGLADGIVGDFMACTTSRVAPKLAAVTCAGAKSDACLTSDQVATLRRVFAGPTNSRGEALYSDWAWDAGIGGKSGSGYNAGWRVWKIGGPGLPFPINVILGSPAMSALFVTPPTPVADDPRANLEFQVGFSMDTDAPKIFARTPEFPRSSWELISAKSTDLSAFRRHGGKMIVPHGVSDPIFSIHDTRRWWERVNAANGNRAAEFVRMYAVPGMNHCSGGPATDRYDCLTAIVEWVERGVAPDRIVATAGPASPWPNRTRPLCPYPTYARYSGSGSIEEQGSFTCR